MNRRIQLITLMMLVGGSVTPFVAAQESPRTVSVTGTAVTKTVPDVVVWHINTRDFDQNLLTAKESSDQKLKAIFGLVEELGIAPEDMQTGQLSVRKVYNRDERGNQLGFKHFAITRSVTLKQRDLKRFDEYITKLLASAEMDVSFSFESSQIHDLRWETRLKAVRVAKEKAEAMLEELGAELGKVIAVEESGPSTTFRSSNIGNVIFDSGGRPVEDLVGGTFAPGAIEVKITVYITFEIA